MAQIINTNIPSLNAQRNLNTSQASLATSLQRLSSGLRINSAKDDAAGLAISERFTTQIRGLNQAIRNANDGISLSQTAEGALGELTNNLQRIRELAVQSANATNSATDREALNQEVQQRIAEIDRIASQTSFNGQKILDGTFGNASFQVGANVGETIDLSLNTSMRANSLGAFVNQTGTYTNALTTVAGSGGVATLTTDAADYDGVSSVAINGSNVTINGSAVNSSADYIGGLSSQDSTSAYAKAAAINGSGIAGVTASASFSKTFTAVTGGLLLDSVDATGATTNGTNSYTLSINGQAVLSASADVTIDDAVSAINSFADVTGVTATKTSAGDLRLDAVDGRNVQIEEAMSIGAATGAGVVGSMDSVFTGLTQTANTGASTVAQDQTFRGAMTISSSEAVTISAGQTIIGFETTDTVLNTAGSLSTTNVSSVTEANDAILAMDAALTSVSALRSTFGAIQNRFESTIANLSTTAENLTASRSRIQDADFAAETANLTRAQILQQAGTAILAQANALPQNVLSLLG